MSAWQKLKDQDRRSLSILAAFFGVMGFYLWVIEPVYKQFEAISLETRALETRMAKERSSAASLPRREARLAEVRKEYEYLLDKLDVENTGAHTLVEVINEIKDFSTEIGVDVEQIRPMPVVSKELYQEMSMEISLHSDFKSFKKFLYYLETSPQIFVVSDLHMTREKNGLAARMTVSKLSLLCEELNQAAKTKAVLRIGLEFWPGYAPFYIAEHKGWLDQEDLSVRLVHGSDRSKLVHLLESRALDGISLSLGGLISTLEQGLDLKAVFPTVWARGAEAIVVSPESSIQGLDDLKGQMVYAPGRLGQYLVFRAMELNQMPFGSIQMESSTRRMISHGMSTGLIRAGVVWDPYLSQLIIEKKGRILFSSEKIPGEIVENLVFHADLINAEHRESIAGLVRVLQRATVWLKDHPKEGGDIVAARLNMGKTSLTQALARVYFPDDQEKRKLIGCGGEKDRMTQLISHQERFLSRVYGKKISIPISALADWSIARKILGCSQNTREKRRE